MAWTLYKSTDASAPVLTGQTGSLITLLDAVLVNGYGSQPAAGWTKVYSGTSKAAYRNGAASISRTYWQVLDNGPGAQTFKEARTRLYSTMSDVDTGTLPTPTVAQSTPGIVVRKSNTADATARAWFILADDKTAIICITAGDTQQSTYTDAVSPVYVGDPYAYLSADAQAAVLCGRVSEGMTTMADANGIGFHSNYGSGSTAMGYIAGSHTGIAGSTALFGTWPSLFAATGAGNQVAYPNAADGAVYVCGPLIIWTSTGYVIRGHLRGLAGFPHIRTSITAWDTVSGTGDLSGHSYILNTVGCASAASGAQFQYVIAFETTAPAYST